ncbi:hypothetical protein G7Z17_g9962 [Cylindrodendrum hubeiense]|uniref:Uncharacterized protein n=1 Tax=Cylindrodendrum hubeiense TaxID=595255 RepID=A0A9P5GYI8_9HYPO|nr:hypothetical protein G7Z17_g9962 [Cylindrodendrum hubeiense]
MTEEHSHTPGHSHAAATPLQACHTHAQHPPTPTHTLVVHPAAASATRRREQARDPRPRSGDRASPPSTVQDCPGHHCPGHPQPKPTPGTQRTQSRDPVQRPSPESQRPPQPRDRAMTPRPQDPKTASRDWDPADKAQQRDPSRRRPGRMAPAAPQQRPTGC